ncbi:MAG: hypothetical protein RL603_2206 [Pseudomonadota bacterium]
MIPSYRPRTTATAAWQFACAALMLLTLSGCASSTRLSNPRDPRDPFEPFNRVMYDVNDRLDDVVGRPLVHGYVAVTPSFVRTGVSNFYGNAKYPVTLINDALQGKFAAAGTDALRFALNSTLGLGGLLDPASGIGLVRNDEDFAQTLGVWGVPEGPYLLIPGLGPYTLLEAFGSLGNRYAELETYIEDDSTRWSIWAGDKFDHRVRLTQVDKVVRRTSDAYTFVRNSYLRRRQYQTLDGNVPPEGVELDPYSDELTDPEAEPASPAPR